MLLDSETVVPPVGAVAVKVTVQVVLAPEARVVGVHTSEETVAAATRLMAAVLEPLPKVAVSVTL